MSSRADGKPFMKNKSQAANTAAALTTSTPGHKKV
jgi:hypothetical protein